jgi:fucose permease
MWHGFSRRWAIFFISVALFILSQFYRAAIAVITPQLIAAVIFSMGTAGNIIATPPLVFLAQAIGWRFSFLLAAVINLVLTICFFRIVRDAPEKPLGSQAMHQGLKKTFSEIRKILSIREYWIISLTSLFFILGVFNGSAGIMYPLFHNKKIVSLGLIGLDVFLKTAVERLPQFFQVLPATLSGGRQY